jgi:hypothetical protein
MPARQPLCNALVNGMREMLKKSSLSAGPDLDWLLAESRELRAIFVQAVATARLNDKRSREQGPV